ncbi:hypothetical protein E2542_SST21213 [Spatholobus suberectus]|nr:hypothetical protein E2542_SST21213 [Spatholobus suberectus]
MTSSKSTGSEGVVAAEPAASIPGEPMDMVSIVTDQSGMQEVGGNTRDFDNDGGGLMYQTVKNTDKPTSSGDSCRVVKRLKTIFLV